MYKLSDEIKEKIVKECFDDICESAQKEEAGAIKNFVNSVIKANIYFDEDNNVAVVGKSLV